MYIYIYIYYIYIYNGSTSSSITRIVYILRHSLRKVRCEMLQILLDTVAKHAVERPPQAHTSHKLHLDVTNWRYNNIMFS